MVAEQEFKQFFQHGGTLLFIILHSHTVHNEISFKTAANLSCRTEQQGPEVVFRYFPQLVYR